MRYGRPSYNRPYNIVYFLISLLWSARGQGNNIQHAVSIMQISRFPFYKSITSTLTKSFVYNYYGNGTDETIGLEIKIK